MLLLILTRRSAGIRPLTEMVSERIKWDLKWSFVMALYLTERHTGYVQLGIDSQWISRYLLSLVQLAVGVIRSCYLF